jgi:hypothetical protein
MHIALADDAFSDLDRPFDIAVPAHETFEDDIGTKHADGDFPGVEVIGGMESALDRSACRRLTMALPAGFVMVWEYRKPDHLSVS